ncbi:pyridoxine 5'-phosphate synthase [bacterium]|nr:pyridoxine 5'-phosphate synthase [bacterium]
MANLGVNIDHVATLRQARFTSYPDVIEAAKICEEAGADGITVHLREDRRHIQDKDVYSLRKLVKTKLNLEMAATRQMVEFASRVVPDEVCIVPEKRRELTTEGGLDVWGQRRRLVGVVKRLRKKGILVSLFVDPEPRQVRAAKEVGADCVELHTGAYAEAKSKKSRLKELEKLKKTGGLAVELGLRLNAGHGLNYENVRPVAEILGVEDLNIGHSIICRSVFAGLAQAVREMKRLVK